MVVTRKRNSVNPPTLRQKISSQFSSIDIEVTSIRIGISRMIVKRSFTWKVMAQKRNVVYSSFSLKRGGGGGLRGST